MSEEKIYVGNGRQVEGQYGIFRSVSICLTDLPKEFIKTAKNGKKYISLTVGDKKEKDKWDNDVAVTVNTWKPENRDNHVEIKEEDPDPLPF